jgi:hypothetical protein
MKKYIIISFCLIFFIGKNTFAQRKYIEQLPNFDKKTWNFGYYLGLNKKGYVIDYKFSNFGNNANVTVDEGIGFNIGVIVDRRLHKNINIRFEPGLSSNVKTLYFNNPFLTTKLDSVRKVPSTYLHLPLLIKFSTDRLRNIRPYLIGGVSYDHNFSSNQDNLDDNSSGEFRTKTGNFMYEVGFGVDFYLPYFKFSPSIRGLFAMNNELVPDNNDAASPWTGPIDRFATRGIFLKLTFE